MREAKDIEILQDFCGLEHPMALRYYMARFFPSVSLIPGV